MQIQGIWCDVTVEGGRTIVRAEDLHASFEVSGEAPVQATGVVLKRELYFRARHDHWHCEVADRTGRLPSDGGSASDGFFYEEAYELGSYMPQEIAVKLIVKCLKEFVGSAPAREPHATR